MQKYSCYDIEMNESDAQLKCFSLSNKAGTILKLDQCKFL